MIELESFSLDIPAGSTVVIGGPNGSGKSTLCKSLLGLIDPVKGIIEYDNIDINKYDISWLRRNISYLPQDIELFNLTIRENLLINFQNNQVLEGLINFKDLDGLVMTAINKVGLYEFINSIPDGLEHMVKYNGRYFSRGIRKRIALARAILTDGKVVVFDEPTESLDLEGSKLIYKILNDYRTKSKTILIASHDPNIIKGAGAIIDLSSKPIPRVGVRRLANKS